MKKSMLVGLALSSIFVFSHTAANALVDLKVEGRYWFTALDSGVKVSTSVLAGTDIDVVDDLGFDDRKNFPEGRIILGIGSHKLRYAYVPLSWDGKKSLVSNVDFAGQTFTAGTTVKSSLDVAYHRLSYEYDIIDLMDNKFGIVVEAKYFGIDAEIKDTLANIKESESINAPLPCVGLSAGVALPMLFNVSAEATGMTFGSYGHIVDAEGMLNFKPLPLLTVSAGYRYFDLVFEAHSGDDKFDFTVKGPFALLRAGF